MKFSFKLAENKPFDAVGFGTNAVDYLIVVPEYPEKYGKTQLSEHFQLAGGEVATTMCGLQRLGLKTTYIGRFGDDHEGEIGLQSLKVDGVDITFTEKVANARTQIAYIVIDRRNGERTVIWDRDKKLAYSAKDAPLEAATQGKILHVTPHDANACVQMAKAAKQANTIVSCDIDNIFEGVETLLGNVDILISSQEFPAKIVGIADKKLALRELKNRFGCAVAGMTLGEKGSLLLCEDTFIETKGFTVPNGCKDTTGAGDAFRVGLLYGILKGENIEDSAKLANAVAALKCREIGARTALPNEEELFELLSFST
jgi:sulfofructose kinase